MIDPSLLSGIFTPDIDWTDKFIERQSFKTSVLLGYSGLEQRVQLRTMPRPGAQFRVLAMTPQEATHLDGLLWSKKSKLLGVPWWQDAQPLQSSIAAGTSVIPVDPTSRYFGTSALVMLWRDQFTYEVGSILAVGTNSITLSGVTAKAWTAPGTKVVPMFAGRLLHKVASQRPAQGIAAVMVDFVGDVVEPGNGFEAILPDAQGCVDSVSLGPHFGHLSGLQLRGDDLTHAPSGGGAWNCYLAFRADAWAGLNPNYPLIDSSNANIYEWMDNDQYEIDNMGSTNPLRNVIVQESFGGGHRAIRATLTAGQTDFGFAGFELRSGDDAWDGLYLKGADGLPLQSCWARLRFALSSNFSVGTIPQGGFLGLIEQIGSFTSTHKAEFDAWVFIDKDNSVKLRLGAVDNGFTPTYTYTTLFADLSTVATGTPKELVLWTGRGVNQGLIKVYFGDMLGTLTKIADTSIGFTPTFGDQWGIHDVWYMEDNVHTPASGSIWKEILEWEEVDGIAHANPFGL